MTPAQIIWCASAPRYAVRHDAEPELTRVSRKTLGLAGTWLAVVVGAFAILTTFYPQV